jgi:signal transduction histidine kinase
LVEIHGQPLKLTDLKASSPKPRLILDDILEHNVASPKSSSLHPMDTIRDQAIESDIPDKQPKKKLVPKKRSGRMAKRMPTLHRSNQEVSEKIFLQEGAQNRRCTIQRKARLVGRKFSSMISNQAGIEAMQRELADLQSKYRRAKIFMYMVIHDLKHPTESLISTVEEVLSKFDDLREQLNALNKQSRHLTDSIKSHRGESEVDGKEDIEDVKNEVNSKFSEFSRLMEKRPKRTPSRKVEEIKIKLEELPRPDL